MRIAISGADGFIGRNLSVRLGELGHEILPLVRGSNPVDWSEALSSADAVAHLAGSNRPPEPSEFMSVNAGITERLVATMGELSRPLPVVYSSSTRAAGEDEYGSSKRAGEDILLEFGRQSGSPVCIYRLPNVFGKWARPSYNSAIATFCYNVARGKAIQVHDPEANLRLCYIDDVVEEFIAALTGERAPGFCSVPIEYQTTVGAVAQAIEGFRTDREENVIARVGTGLTRALYATYVAALPPSEFSYPVVSHRDPRGAFSEMLKTRDSGQFSFFTANPGVTRGGHYHHTKTEKFLIVQGSARFRFRNIVTGDTHEIFTDGAHPKIVETIPGWTHDVTNIGDDTMISMLWANEIFDRDRPDTVAAKV